MSDIDAEESRRYAEEQLERAAKATPGEWRWEREAVYADNVELDCGDANCDFIANSREAVPKLAQMVLDLLEWKSIADELSDRLDEWTSKYAGYGTRIADLRALAHYDEAVKAEQ